MQESIGNIVFPPGEPLRVLLDACLEEEGAMILYNLLSAGIALRVILDK
jgi:hypothetical protein